MSRRGRGGYQAPTAVIVERPALPSQPRGRGRGRGNRGRRGRGRRGGGRSVPGLNAGMRMGSTSGSVLKIVDSEVLGNVPNTLTAYEFNPGVDGTPRLKQFELVFERYRVLYFNIAYISGSAMNVAGQVEFGVLPGPKEDVVKTADDILRLRPSFFVPAWKSETITLSGLIDSSRFMHCGATGDTGVAFTLYAIASAQNLGKIKVSYAVEFAYPRPFPATATNPAVTMPTVSTMSTVPTTRALSPVSSVCSALSVIDIQGNEQQGDSANIA